MKKINTMDKKTLATVAGGIVGTYALATVVLFAINIAQYDTKNLYSYSDLERAQEELEDAQTFQSFTAGRLTDSYYINNKLHSDPQYIELLDQFHKINIELDNPYKYTIEQHQALWTKHEEILEKMALFEDSLFTHCVNKHPDMIMADTRLKNAEKHFNNVQKDCAARDSIKQISFAKRLKSNWNKYKSR